MRALPALIVACAVLAPVAYAQEDTDAAEAKKHYTRGMAHYNLDEFDRAVEEFQAGYRLKPDPVFLYNVAQCYRRAKHPEQALTYYEKYLHATDDNPPNKAEVATRIRDLRKLIKDAGKVESTAPSSPLPPSGVKGSDEVRTTTPRTDETPQKPPVVETPIAPPPNLEVPASAVKSDVDLTAAPTGKPIYKRWWLWAGVGAVVLIAAAITIGVLASRGGSNEHQLPDLMAQ